MSLILLAQQTQQFSYLLCNSKVKIYFSSLPFFFLRHGLKNQLDCVQVWRYEDCFVKKSRFEAFLTFRENFISVFRYKYCSTCGSVSVKLTDLSLNNDSSIKLNHNVYYPHYKKWSKLSVIPVTYRCPIDRHRHFGLATDNLNGKGLGLTLLQPQVIPSILPIN